MIDYDDGGGPPIGTIGWSRLLSAIEQAQPTDETEWVEYKAGVDPSSPAGRAHIARAIVAFANRDPDRAARWFGGYALIVVGLEPGNNLGCVQIDPAQIYDGIQPLLMEPAPQWDHAYHIYNEKSILVFVIAPPRQGDPIACIKKSTDRVVDGSIYVRRPGKSAPPTSADIRRLEARSTPRTDPPSVAITSFTPGGIKRCSWPIDWTTRWADAERGRLLGPLSKALEEEREERFNAAQSGMRPELFEALRGQRPGMRTAFAMLPEDRTPEEYRTEVGTYVDLCKDSLLNCESSVAGGATPQTSFFVTNETLDNLENLEVKLHIEGRVNAYDVDHFVEVRDLCPTPPRQWGPRPSPAMASLSRSMAGISVPYLAPSIAPAPVIKNGGSATITFLPLHLRPGDTSELDSSICLVVLPDFEDAQLNCTWEATATNVSGVMRGQLTVPIGTGTQDLGPLLDHTAPEARGIRPAATD